MIIDKIDKQSIPAFMKIISDAEASLSDLAGTMVIVKLTVPNETPIGKTDMKIRTLVCKEFEVRWEQVVSATKKSPIIDARKAYFFLMHKHSGLSLKQIGLRCGKRDHTTVLHSVNTVRNHIDSNDQPFVDKLNSIMKRLYEVEIY